MLNVSVANSQCTSCLTNMLHLGTGYNHETSAFYPNGTNEQYWMITNGPNSYSYPRCAVSNGDGLGHKIWPAKLNSTGIHIQPGTSLNADGNTVCGNNCIRDGIPYRFERQFCVNTQAFISSSNPNGATVGNMLLQFCGDLNIESVALISPTGSILALTLGCINHDDCTTPDHFLSYAGNFETGVYTIRVELLNDWTCSGPPWNVTKSPTAMTLEVFGSVGSSDYIFTDNAHYGKNTFCAPAYPPSPDFTISGITCILPPTTTSTYTITPFNNAAGQNLYSIVGPGGPAITSSGTFTCGVGNYTVTSTDSNGCSFSDILKVTSTPSITLTPSISCVAPGTNSNVGVNPTPGLYYDYQWSINGATPYYLFASHIPLSQGFYTITAIDANGCTASATATVGNTFNIATTATPPCLPTGGTTLLHTNHSTVWYGPPNFSYNGSPLSTNPDYTISTAGIYTVTASDVFGCSTTNTITVYPTPTPNLDVVALPGCITPFGNTIITATSGSGGPYQYQILTPTSGTTWSALQSSNTFTVATIGKYEVRVIDNVGCPSVPQIVYVGNCNNCHSEIPPSNARWYIDATSSAVFPGGVTPNSPLVIEGTLTVDDNLNIWNNPNVYFTYNSKIEMTNISTPNQLYIENSTLKPCWWWWRGAFSTSTKQKIKINGSRVKNMSYMPTPFIPPWSSLCGFNLTKGAVIEATNNTFQDNLQSLLIIESPGVYPGIIENNTFVNYGYFINWGLPSLVLWDVENARIGGPLNDVNKGNTFENLQSGIVVFTGDNHYSSPFSSIIKIYNSVFKNIKLYNNTDPLHEFKALWPNYPATPYPSHGVMFGTAISSLGGQGWLGNKQHWPNLNLEVKDFTNNYDDSYTFFPGIYDCDHGVNTVNTNLVMDKLYVSNTLFANMNYSSQLKNYDITNNFIHNSHIGIRVDNAINKASISGNTIHLRNTEIATPIMWPSGGTTVLAPEGISVNYMFQNTNPSLGIYNNIENNIISLPYRTGFGISCTKGDAHQSISKNEIFFGTASTLGTSTHNHKALYGIMVNKSEGCTINQNFITGISNLSVWNVRNSMGIYMNNSPKCGLNCNRAKYTRYGFYAWGNNNNGPASIMHNKFSGNRYPWYFLDAGGTVPATFGTQGTATIDNGNNFLGLSNRLNSSGFKVFRNSLVPSPDFIITSNSLLTVAESGSVVPFAEYQVSNPLGIANTDPCPAPLFITGTGDSGDGDEDSDELVDIVEDDVDYIGHEEVGEWIDETRVYEALESDSTLRYSSLAMQEFYNTRNSSLIGRIYEANRAIALLASTSTDATNFENRYNAALLANNLIIDGEPWEMNEKYVNDIHLKLLTNSHIDTIGYDTLYVDSLLYYVTPKIEIISSSEQDFLRDLANSCPFVNGTCVYRARILWAMFDPVTTYDDRVLCIEGANKNSDNRGIDIDSLYESKLEALEKGITIKPQNNIHTLKNGEVSIYPNPTSSNIIIEYNCPNNGRFELTNNLGQIVLKTELGEGKRKVLLQVNDLSAGLYFYKCSFDSCEDAYGKLIIK